jgi:Phage tail protein
MSFGTVAYGVAPYGSVLGSVVAPPALLDWQVYFNGLIVGMNTAYGLLQIEGLDLPALRSGDVARPRDTGQFVGLDLFGGRDITLTIDMTTDGISLQDAATSVATAFAPPSDGQTESPIYFQFPNLPLLVAGCRVRKRAIAIDLPWSQGFVKSAVIGLHATDPRIYGTTLDPTVALPTPPGGVHFPITYPLSFGGGSIAGTISADNSGNSEMRPIVVITGPCTNPTVTNTTLGESLTFSNPSQTSYTLYSGDTLTVDLDAHQIIYTPNGSTSGASRRNWLVTGSTWWNLPPGISTIDFSTADASLPSPVPTCQVLFAPTYLSAT